MTDWQPTACILCTSNCGLEVRLGGEDGRHLVQVRGDRQHPASRGYACEKPQRLDFYQNGADRLTHPLRRRPDGTFEKVTWETAIAEVAERLAAVRDQHGGRSILFYGGGGQGNHLGGVYAAGLRTALNSEFRSSALAQEKTGEFWVAGRMMGGWAQSDLERCEVAIFVGKNPWQSHGFPRARITLKEIARDPGRTLIVIDPRLSETAEMADIHLRPFPGTDAWLLAAMLAVIVQEGLTDDEFITQHTTGCAQVLAILRDASVAEQARRCGVPEDLIRKAARRTAAAASVGLFEDLGVQMNRHSTLVSWLDHLVWLLTGNFGRPGAKGVPTTFVPLVSIAFEPAGEAPAKVSPVVGARIISGLVPCNVIPDEILSDHPDRYRAMCVLSSNPAHSIAGSQRVREALASLEFLLVVDVAMTETAKMAHYVLPALSQFEKAECTFFNFEFPENYFHLRHPVLPPPPGSDLLTEAEIYTRLVEALGALPASAVGDLRRVAAETRPAFGEAFAAWQRANRALGGLTGSMLYRTLGAALSPELAPAAGLWAFAQQFAKANARAVRAAGIDGDDAELGERLFAAILSSPRGLVISVEDPEDAWRRVATPDGRIHLHVWEMATELEKVLASEPDRGTSAEFPILLSAGERRSTTANTAIRNPGWLKPGTPALRVSRQDARRLGLADGGKARVTTKNGSAIAGVEVSGTLMQGHASLPNGVGLGYPGSENDSSKGVAPNELTSTADRDWFAGTPWHKSVPARIDPVP